MSKKTRRYEGRVWVAGHDLQQEGLSEGAVGKLALLAVALQHRLQSRDRVQVEEQLHRQLRAVAAHRGPAISVSVSPCGARLFSGSSDYLIKMWDTATGEEVRTFAGHGGWVRAVSVSPCGAHLFSGSHDR